MSPPPVRHLSAAEAAAAAAVAGTPDDEKDDPVVLRQIVDRQLRKDVRPRDLIGLEPRAALPGSALAAAQAHTAAAAQSVIAPSNSKGSASTAPSLNEDLLKKLRQHVSHEFSEPLTDDDIRIISQSLKFEIALLGDKHKIANERYIRANVLDKVDSALLGVDLGDGPLTRKAIITMKEAHIQKEINSIAARTLELISLMEEFDRWVHKRNVNHTRSVEYQEWESKFATIQDQARQFCLEANLNVTQEEIDAIFAPLRGAIPSEELLQSIEEKLEKAFKTCISTLSPEKLLELRERVYNEPPKTNYFLDFQLWVLNRLIGTEKEEQIIKHELIGLAKILGKYNCFMELSYLMEIDPFVMQKDQEKFLISMLRPPLLPKAALLLSLFNAKRYFKVVQKLRENVIDRLRIITQGKLQTAAHTPPDATRATLKKLAVDDPFTPESAVAEIMKFASVSGVNINHSELSRAIDRVPRGNSTALKNAVVDYLSTLFSVGGVDSDFVLEFLSQPANLSLWPNWGPSIKQAIIQVNDDQVSADDDVRRGFLPHLPLPDPRAVARSMLTGRGLILTNTTASDEARALEALTGIEFGDDFFASLERQTDNVALRLYVHRALKDAIATQGMDIAKLKKTVEDPQNEHLFQNWGGLYCEVFYEMKDRNAASTPPQ